MARRRNLILVVWIGAWAALGGCKPPEPDPSQNTDLGDGGRILLPTPPAWHDKSVAKEQAEWKSFRKPTTAANTEAGPSGTGGAGGAAGAAAAGGAVEKEIRDLVDEFNGLVKEGKYKEALDYLSEEQAAAAEKYIQAAPAYEQKLKEVIEVAPAVAERARKVIELISLEKTFLFGVKDLKVISAMEVVGSYVDASAGKPPASDKNLEVRFVKGESGDWFIESKVFKSLDVLVPAMSKATESLDAFVVAAKSGSLAGAELDEKVATLNSGFDRLIALFTGEPKSDAQAPAEEPKPEPAPEEPPPKPKKPVTGG